MQTKIRPRIFTNEEKIRVMEYKKMLIKENRRSSKHERDVLAKEMSKTPKQIKCLLQNLRHPDQIHFRRSGKKSILRPTLVRFWTNFGT